MILFLKESVFFVSVNIGKLPTSDCNQFVGDILAVFEMSFLSISVISPQRIMPPSPCQAVASATSVFANTSFASQ